MSASASWGAGSSSSSRRAGFGPDSIRRWRRRGPGHFFSLSWVRRLDSSAGTPEEGCRADCLLLAFSSSGSGPGRWPAGSCSACLLRLLGYCRLSSVGQAGGSAFSWQQQLELGIAPGSSWLFLRMIWFRFCSRARFRPRCQVADRGSPRPTQCQNQSPVPSSFCRRWRIRPAKSRVLKRTLSFLLLLFFFKFVSLPVI